MNKFLRLSVLFVIGRVSMAQDLPYETEAMRKPALHTGGTVLIKDARILTASHGTIERGSILVRNGKIEAIGDINPPAGVQVIDAHGKVVSPGIVDCHIHRGSDSTNEGSDAITAEVRIQDVLNPTNRNVWQAVASGETSGLILHGSANPIGGQSLVVKLKYGKSPAELPIPDAPRMIKFALGENVTRSGSDNSTRFPHTRLGVQAVYRRAFTEAREYMKKWDAYNANKQGNPPQRDLRLETLADILRGKIWVNCHSYRADEILMMVRLSQEFGFHLGAMQHALESYKIAPELAEAGIPASIFADSWGFKLEGYDAIPYAASILHQAGVLVTINTDGTGGTTAINLDAAKAMKYGGVSEQEALKMITLNAAKTLGIDKRTGSIDVGKDADLVIWSGHPLSVYSHPDMTLIEGEVYFQRRDAFGIDRTSTVKTKLDDYKYIPTQTMPKLGKSYAIVGATVHTVSGSTIPSGVVVMENGKITAVGKSVPIPPSAVKIDGKGMHVYPGFIDAGTTLGLTEFGQVGQATDASEFGTNQPDLIGAVGLQVQSEAIPPARCNGITSFLTAPRGGSISGQASIMNSWGWTNEQMEIEPRGGLVINLGGGGGFRDFENDSQITDEDCGDDYLGLGAAQRGGGGASTADLGSYFDKAVKYGQSHAAVDTMMEAMQPYVNGKGRVYLRVRNASAIRDAVDLAKKYNLNAILVGAPDAWREAKLLKESNIPVILTVAGESTLDANLTVSDYDPYDTPYACAAVLQREGVKFCFQTDDNAMVMTLPQRVGEHCAYGLKPDEAIRSMTLSAAEILGVSDKIGSIDPGKLGNLVITDGDPMEFTSNVRYVFINGQPVELTSKHTRLRDQYLKRLEN